jgi:very-short-patch-repair endonuclease
LFALIGRWMEGHVRWDVPEIPHRRDRRSIGAGPMGGQVEARPNSSVLHSDGRAAWRAWTGEQDEGIERAERVFCVLEQQHMEPGRDFGPRLRAGQNGRNLLERWASAYGSVGPDILRRLGEGDARVLELAQDIQRARAFPADWITAWIQAGRTSPERELWDALDAWIGARADWDKQWAPWSKVFSQRVVTATDEVWTAWTEAHQGLGQWFRRRAWRKAVQQWEKPNTTWADWTRWSWERTTVRKVYEAVRQAGARLEQQAQVCKVAAPGRGRGRVDTATLIAMAAWGGATGTTLQTIPGGQEMAEAFWHGNNDLIQPDGLSLMEAYAAVQPWLAAVRPTDVQQFIDRIDQSVRRKWSGVEQKTDGGRGGSPQGDMASTVWQNSARLMYLAEEVDLHQEDLDRRRTWRNAIQQEDAQVLMDWWANHTEQSRANLRLRVDEIWSAWQAGLRAQNILMEHEELARALGVERDSLITLYRDILAGEDARARQEVVDGLLSRARAAIGSPEAAILAREALRRRPTGARSLLRQLPTLAPALLPCMMMSPLSAAEYLPSEWRFDVVIFDEASQISVGDAIGAVARGQTVIVVGDDKQMPPTSIFAGNAADTTSILDECLAAGVPKSVLTWHYRSQQERLIAFSNSTYYHGELMTFPDTRVGRGDGETNDQVTANPLDDLSEIEGPAAPAPTSDIGTGRPGDPFEEIGGSGGAESSESMGAPRQDIGIEAPCVGEVVLGGGGLYVQEINGLYDRGGAGTNHEEALAIVRALTRHLEEGTQETIGVITFNRKQQNLIEDLWDRLLVEQPHLESLAGGLEKPITVRNLENAQGDERDVVLFSTTFGRDARGRFPMTFGPLGQPGGERRLNVAITRAKRRLVVYTSFRPQDIDLSRVSGQGVRDLRAWLAFARGEHEAVLIPAHNTDGQVDSPFERAVRTALERLGWTVHGQVGCSGYRIDLAVVDPNNPQRYLAGVECDGATYHSIKSARDRDVLRTQILENRGWRIQRVWSTHWFRRPEAALEDLHRQLLALRDRPAA